MELKRKRLRYIILRDSIVLTVGALYAVFVSVTGLALPCFIKVSTGFKCPGCGITRASIAVLHGDIKTSFAYNPFLYFVGPVIAYLIIKYDISYVKYGCFKSSKIDTFIICICIISAVLYGILRNII